MKRFFLVRHAHRDVFNSHDDNGLSAKGRKQSLALRDFFVDTFKNSKSRPHLISSPRLRCQETLAPLADAFNIDLHIEHLLDEGAHQKTSLTKAVKEFVSTLRRSKEETIIACSHGDWIPLFFLHVSGAEESLKKSGLCEFEIDEDEFKIKMIHGAF